MQKGRIWDVEGINPYDVSKNAHIHVLNVGLFTKDVFRTLKA